MKTCLRIFALVVMFIIASSFSLNAQNNRKNNASEGYKFTIEKSIPATSVKDQHRTSTCWSFATTSFIESELLRTGKGEYNLSEMYFVRKAYELKAEKYTRLQGKINFAAGGLAMDVMQIWKESGLIPEQYYDGLTLGEDLPVHSEMDAVLLGYMNQVIKNPNGKLSPVWKAGFNGILDAYLGLVPATFDIQGSTYTPKSFGESVGLDPDNYVAIGSFTHQAFYEQFVIEIPDNWMWGTIYNAPLNEMMEVLDNALETGYTVCWDADVGERGYNWKLGVALFPSMEFKDLSQTDQAKWDKLSEREQQALFYDFSSPKKEKVITQDIRQMGFDNYQTTDDHLMHITGWAKDQFGNKYYLVKNSWGTGNHIYQGYFYVSEAYMRAKTIFFMVHKDAVPSFLAKELDF